MRGFLDRDFLRTVEGFLFCVVGCVHPRDRVISYLKYVPAPDGRWGKPEERYSRTMPNYTIPSLADNLNMLTKHHPHYVFRSRVFNVEMSAVPRRFIAKHYCPEKKLKQLFKSEGLDPLQERVLQLVSHLSEEALLPKDCFGVTGSILTGIHQPKFSDIDLTVYGLENGWKIRRFLKREFRAKGRILTRHRGEGLAKLLDRWSKNYPLTLMEAGEIYERRWNHGFFKEKAFSVHVVKTRREVEEEYGDKIFKPLKIVEGKAEITDVADSLFLPCVYGVDFLEPLSDGVEVERVVSYDGFYGGIFDVGDRVLVKGKLEKVTDRRSGKSYHRILVGSLEARGQDYIKPIL